MLPIIAAGNDGADASYYTPSKVKDAIVVGAFDEHDRMTYFSNYGSAVTMLAPGTDILSTFASEELGYMSGTSQAAPIVTGSAALIVSKDSSLTPNQVRSGLIDACIEGTISARHETTTRVIDISRL
jgi:subtilisin family serine protease